MISGSPIVIKWLSLSLRLILFSLTIFPRLIFSSPSYLINFNVSCNFCLFIILFSLLVHQFPVFLSYYVLFIFTKEGLRELDWIFVYSVWIKQNWTRTKCYEWFSKNIYWAHINPVQWLSIFVFSLNQVDFSQPVGWQKHNWLARH